MKPLVGRVVRFVSHRIGAADRSRLERALRGPLRRRAVLWTLFGAMPRFIRRRALERENIVVEWRITGRRDGRQDVRQLVIGDGAAAVLEGEPHEADLILTLSSVDFLLVATGNAMGPALFVSGALELEGDPWLAMRLPRIFGAPGPPREPRPTA